MTDRLDGLGGCRLLPPFQGYFRGILVGLDGWMGVYIKGRPQLGLSGPFDKSLVSWFVGLEEEGGYNVQPFR